MTGPPAGDAFARELQAELLAATEQAQLADDNPTAVLAALDRLAVMIRTLDEVRAAASEETKRLIARALHLGVDPRDLYGKPFSSTIVRDIATREVGIVFERRGPRPRSRPHQRGPQ